MQKCYNVAKHSTAKAWAPGNYILRFKGGGRIEMYGNLFDCSVNASGVNSINCECFHGARLGHKQSKLHKGFAHTRAEAQQRVQTGSGGATATQFSPAQNSRLLGEHSVHQAYYLRDSLIVCIGSHSAAFLLRKHSHFSISVRCTFEKRTDLKMNGSVHAFGCTLKERYNWRFITRHLLNYTLP